MRTKTIYFATKALIVNEGKFLAVHKSNVNYDLYELPGGRLEFGETPEETLEREIKEELSIKLNPVKIIDTWTFISDDYQIVGVIYLCTIKDGTITLSEEHDKYKWLPLEKESSQYMHKVFNEKMCNWDFDNIIK